MDPKDKKETILLENPTIIDSETVGGLIYVLSPNVVLPLDAKVDMKKLRDIQIEYQTGCEQLHIDNVADFATRKQRLQDFLRVCEDYFLTNFGSTLLVIGMTIQVVEFSNRKIPKT